MSAKRKDQHIRYALKQKRGPNDFDQMSIPYNSLVAQDIEDVDLSTKYLNQVFPYPFYINAMTGGSKKGRIINSKLAKLAAHFGIPMVVGSMNMALKDIKYLDTFLVARQENPNGFVIANLSANANLEEAKTVVHMIQANALTIHLNVLQELIMPEGDRTFKHWKANIKNIVKGIGVPVVVKEVGFGMSKETVKELIDLGVKYVDVSGKGGTNFAYIENKRARNRYHDFTSIGISTYASLVQNKEHMDQIEVFASGGIRGALDIQKALSLGAKAVGLSYFFLKLTKLSTEKAIEEVEKMIEDLKKVKVLTS